jgi:hypothetical protein
MKLSLKFLQEKSACYDGLKWYTENGKINTVEKCVTALIADTDCSEHLNYANWLLSNTLSPDNKIRYAIFAAEQVLELFENATPGDLRPRKAIEAAKEYLKTKTAAAGDAARAAGDAAYNQMLEKIINYGLSILEAS